MLGWQILGRKDSPGCVTAPGNRSRNGIPICGGPRPGSSNRQPNAGPALCRSGRTDCLCWSNGTADASWLTGSFHVLSALGLPHCVRLLIMQLHGEWRKDDPVRALMGRYRTLPAVALVAHGARAATVLACALWNSAQVFAPWLSGRYSNSIRVTMLSGVHPLCDEQKKFTNSDGRRYVA